MLPPPQRQPQLNLAAHRLQRARGEKVEQRERARAAEDEGGQGVEGKGGGVQDGEGFLGDLAAEEEEGRGGEGDGGGEAEAAVEGVGGGVEEGVVVDEEAEFGGEVEEGPGVRGGCWVRLGEELGLGCGGWVVVVDFGGALAAASLCRWTHVVSDAAFY